MHITVATHFCTWVVLSCTKNDAGITRPFSFDYKTQNNNLEREIRDLAGQIRRIQNANFIMFVDPAKLNYGDQPYCSSHLLSRGTRILTYKQSQTPFLQIQKHCHLEYRTQDIFAWEVSSFPKGRQQWHSQHLDPLHQMCQHLVWNGKEYCYEVMDICS